MLKPANGRQNELSMNGSVSRRAAATGRPPAFSDHAGAFPAMGMPFLP